MGRGIAQVYPSTLGFNVLRAWRGLRENLGPGTVGGSREETQSWGRSVLEWVWGAVGQSLVLGLGQREV